MLLSNTHDYDANANQSEFDGDEPTVSTDCPDDLLDVDAGGVSDGGGDGVGIFPAKAIDGNKGDKEEKDSPTPAKAIYENDGDTGDDDQSTQAKASNRNKGDKGDNDQPPPAIANPRIKTLTDYEDLPKGGAIRTAVFKSTVAQANEVNKRGTRLNKDIWNVGDICNVELEGNIRGATGPKYLSVAITAKETWYIGWQRSP